MALKAAVEQMQQQYAFHQRHPAACWRLRYRHAASAVCIRRTVAHEAGGVATAEVALQLAAIARSIAAWGERVNQSECTGSIAKRDRACALSSVSCFVATDVT